MELPQPEGLGLFFDFIIFSQSRISTLQILNYTTSILDLYESKATLLNQDSAPGGVSQECRFDSCRTDCWHRFKNASYKETQMVIGNLLTFAAEFVVLAFIGIAGFDFVLGLHRLWKTSGTQSSSQKPRLETVVALKGELQHQQAKVFVQTQVVDDPWLADINTPTCHSTATIATPKPLLLLPPAPSVVEQPELELDLTTLKLYKLHSHSVVRVSDLPLEIPPTIKRHKLHKRDVVRLIDLEQLLAAL